MNRYLKGLTSYHVNVVESYQPYNGVDDVGNLFCRGDKLAGRDGVRSALCLYECVFE